MDRLISEQAVLDLIADYDLSMGQVVKGIHALPPAQKSIIDKIRTEIMDMGAYEQEVNGKTKFLEGINYCLGVIDKYKAESEPQESEVEDGNDD